ncbi:MAG TPA: DUF5667 domain-containing protein [Candidatus Paceibacterota bacterium]|nr:DUF5667 domain-containing protein [Candidatus Paceibacterota bacterium]
MNNPLNKLNSAAKNIRLSHDEKAGMRARIFEIIDGAKYAPAPRQRAAVFTAYSWFSVRYATALAAVLVIVLGSSTAYAAKGALPGGILYPVKIYVNEKVAGALAVSDEAKLSYHTSVAQERLEEAETLASQGRLDTSATAQIASNFEEHVAQADVLAQAIEEKDPSAGVEAKLTLDSSLSAHGSILASLGRDSRDTQTQENSDSLAMRVRSRDADLAVAAAPARTAKAMAPMAAKMQVSMLSNEAAPGEEEATTSDDVSATAALEADTESAEDAQASAVDKKIAMQLQKKALYDLSQARKAYAQVADSLDATTTDKVQSQLAQLETQAKVGDSELRDGAYADARAMFSAVLKGGIELKALIEASAKFDGDFVHASIGGWGGATSQDDDSDNDGSGQAVPGLPVIPF